MTKGRPVAVKRLPESVSVAEAQELDRELRSVLETDRPCLVFDFSDVRQIDTAGVELLLRCMEEAVMRNGDVKLAAVSPTVAAILQLTRVDRLFEIFDKPDGAVESFYRFPVHGLQADELKNIDRKLRVDGD